MVSLLHRATIINSQTWRTANKLLCITVTHNTAQNSFDNLPFYPPDNLSLLRRCLLEGRAKRSDSYLLCDGQLMLNTCKLFTQLHQFQLLDVYRHLHSPHNYWLLNDQSRLASGRGLAVACLTDGNVRDATIESVHGPLWLSSRLLWYTVPWAQAALTYCHA